MQLKGTRALVLLCVTVLLKMCYWQYYPIERHRIYSSILTWYCLIGCVPSAWRNELPYHESWVNDYVSWCVRMVSENLSGIGNLPVLLSLWISLLAAAESRLRRKRCSRYYSCPLCWSDRPGPPKYATIADEYVPCCNRRFQRSSANWTCEVALCAPTPLARSG